jgi:hypothetical protein
MYAIIKMDENKNLHKISTPTIYNHENNTDQILILLPQYYGNLDIRECSVTLNWIQPESDSSSNINNVKGNIKLLEFEEELYKDKFLQAATYITVTETSTVGKVEIFLEINNSTNNTIMKTSSTFLEIKPHTSITDYIPEETIDILSDYLIKMQQLNNSCDQTLELAIEQANKAIQSANLIVDLMKRWEEEHT